MTRPFIYTFTLETYETLIDRLTEGANIDERLDKMVEECYELIDAVSAFSQNKSSDLRADVFDEMADVRILLDELTRLLGLGEMQSDFLLFKASRELCRRHHGDPHWCASHPEKYAPQSSAAPRDPAQAVSDAQESALEAAAMADDLTSRSPDNVDSGTLEDLADAFERTADAIRTAASALEVVGR